MNLKDMKEFIRIFDKSTLTELEIEDGDNRLYLSKLTGGYTQPAAAYAAPATVPPVNYAAPQSAAPSTEAAPAETGKTIESPMIGTYYSAPTPGAAPFVNAGDIVEKGQTLCIIEAMKIMNTIEADYRCKIVKILVENGKPVEYGQDIFVVEPL